MRASALANSVLSRRTADLASLAASNRGGFGGGRFAGRARCGAPFPAPVFFFMGSPIRPFGVFFIIIVNRKRQPVFVIML